MLLLPRKIIALATLGLVSFSAVAADGNILGKPGPDGRPVGSLSDVATLAEGPRTVDEYDEEDRLMQEEATAESREPASVGVTAEVSGVAKEILAAESASLFIRVHDALARLK